MKITFNVTMQREGDYHIATVTLPTSVRHTAKHPVRSAAIDEAYRGALEQEASNTQERDK